MRSPPISQPGAAHLLGGQGRCPRRAPLTRNADRVAQQGPEISSTFPAEPPARDGWTMHARGIHVDIGVFRGLSCHLWGILTFVGCFTRAGFPVRRTFSQRCKWLGASSNVSFQISQEPGWSTSSGCRSSRHRQPNAPHRRCVCYVVARDVPSTTGFCQHDPDRMVQARDGSLGRMPFPRLRLRNRCFSENGNAGSPCASRHFRLLISLHPVTARTLDYVAAAAPVCSSTAPQCAQNAPAGVIFRQFGQTTRAWSSSITLRSDEIAESKTSR